MDKEINKELEQEKVESEILVNEGFNFKAGWFRFNVRPIKLGTILKANKYAMKIKFDVLKQVEDDVAFLDDVYANINPLLNFISIAVLGSRIKIFLFRRFLKGYLKWKLRVNEAPLIALAVIQMYNIENFTTSIRLIGQMTMTSPKKPNLMDGKQED